MSTMKSAQTVYYGPNTSTYPSAGNVSSGEQVTAKWKEGTYVFIEYNITGSSQKKRGYVTATAITVTESVPTNSFTLTSKTANTAATTYHGPSTTTYPSAGSVSAGEAVKQLTTEGTFSFIEYNITGSSQKKRAYVATSVLGTGSSGNNIIKDPITTNVNLTGYDSSGHRDYPVGKGTPVYAACDGTFKFEYRYGKKTSTSSTSYISLGRGTYLTPAAGWKTASGQSVSKIEYGHFSSYKDYPTPAFVERCENSSWGTNYSENSTVLATKAVKQGELLGYSGNSGNTFGATGNHLHIKLYF